MSLADRLHQLRLKRGLTQSELSSVLEIPRSLLANYEQGRRQPLLDTLLKIADFYGVSLDYLAGRDDYSLASFISTTPGDESEARFREMVEQSNTERHLFPVPLFDPITLEYDRSKTKWVQLPNVNYDAGYVATYGLSVSQLDKFNDAVLFLETGGVFELRSDPTYFLMKLKDGALHIAVMVDEYAELISTKDFHKYNHPEMVWQILKVEHNFT